MKLFARRARLPSVATTVFGSAALVAALLAGPGGPAISGVQPVGHAAHAQPAVGVPAAPAPDDPRQLEHRRLIEAHARAARAGPPPPLPPPPRDGVIVLPIDMSRPRSLAKPDGPPAAPASRSSSAASSTPKPPVTPSDCPNQLPYPNHSGLMPAMRTKSLTKAFPELTWHVCVTDMGHKGLWVGPVELQVKGSGKWIPVLYQAGPAEIFVPYHQTPGYRFYDLHWVDALSPLSAQDAGPNGSPIRLTNEQFDTVVTEVRDRGLAWLCHGATNTNAARHGQEFVVWGVSDAGNYDNIIEYGFRDDGTITFRVGNTGYNSPPRPLEPHAHEVLWYIDADLGGPSNSASLLFHEEPSPPQSLEKAEDKVWPVLLEQNWGWMPERNFSLLLHGSFRNPLNHGVAYEFSPMQNALLRHYGFKESWTRSDIAVTRYDYAESEWASPIVGWRYPDDYWVSSLNHQVVINGKDIVVWVKSTVDHRPKDEDRSAADLTTGGMTGVTLAHWSGFKMEPNNLFAANPLGAPSRCG